MDVQSTEQVSKIKKKKFYLKWVLEWFPLKRYVSLIKMDLKDVSYDL